MLDDIVQVYSTISILLFFPLKKFQYVFILFEYIRPSIDFINLFAAGVHA